MHFTHALAHFAGEKRAKIGCSSDEIRRRGPAEFGGGGIFQSETAAPKSECVVDRHGWQAFNYADFRRNIFTVIVIVSFVDFVAVAVTRK